MSPIEEQQAMQDYVRQQLLLKRQGGLNLALPQQPGEIPQRPPLAPGVGAPPPVEQPTLPGVELQGGYAPPLGRQGQPEPLNYRAMYRQNVPF